MTPQDSLAAQVWSVERPASRRYAEMFARRWVLALSVALTVAAIVGPFVLGLPSLYRATATVLISGPLTDSTIQPTVPGDIDARLQAIKAEAFSRAHLTELLERFNLYPSLRHTGALDAAILDFQHDITVANTSTQEVNGQSATIAFAVSYLAGDPVTAAAVSNALTGFYVDRNHQMRAGQATETANLLGQQLNDVKRRLDDEEARLRGYATTGLGGLPQQRDANLAVFDRLNTELRGDSDEQLRLIDRRDTLETQIAQLTTQPPVSADPTSPAARLDALRKEYAELPPGATDQYPGAKDLKSQIAALEKQLAAPFAHPGPGTSATQLQTVRQELSETNTRLAELEKEKQSLRTQSSAYQNRLESAGTHEVDLQSALSDAQATRDQYDTLLKRYADAQLAQHAEGGAAEEFRVLDRAVPPASPTGPNRWRLLAVAVILALGAGLGASLVAERVDASFHTVDDLREFTRVPVLASIPRIRTPMAVVRGGLRASTVTVVGILALLSVAVVVFHVAHGREDIARLFLRLG